MKATLYKTFICPRCYMAVRALEKLQSEFPELTIETVEVTREPLRAWQAGVRMLPTVICNGKNLSGIFLTKASLRELLSL